MDAQLYQELKLTPQLLLSMKLLQMNSQELTEYLTHLLEENPVLEQEDRSAAEVRFAELQKRFSGPGEGEPSDAGRDRAPVWEPGRPDRETESLSAFLRDQLERRHLSKNLMALTEYLVELLDENGYLEQEDLDDLTKCRIPEKMVREAVGLLQELEPAGVGARSLSECLLLQLTRRQAPAYPAEEIVTRFLPLLARKRYASIAEKLGCSLDEVLDAAARIEELDPHPGRVFSSPEPTSFITPDIFVYEADGEWKIELSDYYLPRVYLSDYYLRALRESEENETQEYLRDKVQQARWLLRTLSQRGKTLQRCAEAVFQAQKGFFTGSTPELQPLSFREIGETLSLHPSTVSRAVHGKYLQCHQGTFPLRHFFSRAVNEGLSRQAVKQKLTALIRAEDPSRPLSDQRLCELLAGQGIAISRRAVAKYRTELGVAASSVRRKS